MLHPNIILQCLSAIALNSFAHRMHTSGPVGVGSPHTPSGRPVGLTSAGSPFKKQGQSW